MRRAGRNVAVADDRRRRSGVAPAPLQRYKRFISNDLCPWFENDEISVLGINTARSLTIKDGRINREQIALIKRRFAAVSRFSQAIVERYGLAAAGYHFETGSEADCFERFEAAVAEKAWVVVPLWHPQYLHARYTIRALEEPLDLLGDTDAATLIVRRDAEARVGAAALADLAALQLGNARVSALENALVRNSG